MSAISRRTMLQGGIAGAAMALINDTRAPGQPLAVPSGAPPDAPLPSVKRKGNIQQSVSRWCYQHIPLDQLCTYAAHIGLEGIDLLQPEEYDVPARYGLLCTMGYAGGGEINKGLNRPENHDAIEAGLRKYIPVAAKAGIPNVITFSGLRDGLSDEEGARNTIVGLKRMRTIAEDHGVNLCMELLNSKVDHHGYMCDHTAWGLSVVQEVNSPRIKLLNDLYHMQIMEGDLIATIRKHHEWFAHFHTGGVPGRHELDNTQEVQWDGVMRAIAATGFKGYIAHEFVPARDPLTSLREAVDLCDV